MKEEGTANTEPLKKKKKSRTSDVKTDILFRHGLSQTEISQYYEEECQMANNDRVIQETYHKKNELESYIYEFRGKLAEKYRAYVDSHTAESFLALLAENEAWLYADGLKTTKGAYIAKLENLKKMGDPIQKRAQEFEELPEHIQNLLDLVENAQQGLASNVY